MVKGNPVVWFGNISHAEVSLAALLLCNRSFLWLHSCGIQHNIPHRIHSTARILLLSLPTHVLHDDVIGVEYNWADSSNTGLIIFSNVFEDAGVNVVSTLHRLKVTGGQNIFSFMFKETLNCSEFFQSGAWLMHFQDGWLFCELDHLENMLSIHCL